MSSSSAACSLAPSLPPVWLNGLEFPSSESPVQSSRIGASSSPAFIPHMQTLGLFVAQAPALQHLLAFPSYALKPERPRDAEPLHGQAS